MFHDVALPDLSPWERSAIYQSMLDTLVHLHAIPVQSLGLAGFSTSDYCQRQVSKWNLAFYLHFALLGEGLEWKLYSGLCGSGQFSA